MSLRPQPIPPVPEKTARIARAAFPHSNLYLKMRDDLGAIFTDEDFAALFPKRGQPAEAPWRLALATIKHIRPLCRPGLQQRFVRRLPSRRRRAIPGQPLSGTQVNASPNIGLPLLDCTCVASSWMTSQCSTRIPSCIRRMSAAIQFAYASNPEKGHGR